MTVASDINRHEVLRRDEQRWHRTLANAQIVTQRYATTVWPGHWKSRTNALNFADHLAHRAEHIIVLVRDVPAVKRERRSLGLHRSRHCSVITVENQVSSHDRLAGVFSSGTAPRWLLSMTSVTSPALK